MANTSIDSTQEGTGLGRLANHGDKPRDRNARMKVVSTADGPALCLFATRNITTDEQVLYDYGVKVPWSRKVGETHYTDLMCMTATPCPIKNCTTLVENLMLLASNIITCLHYGSW